MLDNLIEPFVRAASYISYKNDYGRKSANIRFTTSNFDCPRSLGGLRPEASCGDRR
ncbi:hypothetical protein Bra5_PB00004 (plasmid) [Rhizobium phaseoli Brasil 5]|nr:hypothetical protein Bra5_PB00004 [Rhizobium phaseoli Brasil 5]